MAGQTKPSRRATLLTLLICLSVAGILIASEFMRPSLPISSPVHRVGDLVKDEERDLTIVVKNDAPRAVRLVGASETCGPEGCAWVVGLPATVPPRGEFGLTVHFRAGLEGDFIKEIPVYTDYPEQSSFILKVSGNVLCSD